MATKAPKTLAAQGAGAFERYVDNRRAASAEFHAEYLAAKTEIVAVDAIINALEQLDSRVVRCRPHRLAETS